MSLHELDDLFELIPKPNGGAIRCWYTSHRSILQTALVSLSDQHKEGPGAFLEQLTSVMSMAVMEHDLEHTIHPLPFSCGDMLLVLSWRKIDRLWRYMLEAGEQPQMAGLLSSPEGRYQFRLDEAKRSGIELNFLHRNALLPVDQIGAGRKTEKLLALFCDFIIAWHASDQSQHPHDVAHPWPEMRGHRS